jgi:hypothetical protein
MTMVEVYAVTAYVFAEGNILDKAMVPTVHAELRRLRARSDAGGQPCRRATTSGLRTCASFIWSSQVVAAAGPKAILANAARVQGRPGYTRLTDLERQLRCQRCGARGKASLDVEFRPRD